jgi:predicted SAM-dependent methyltransferase
MPAHPPHPYDKHYFHGGAKVGGYASPGYRDFPVHWTTYARVMERKPESVLELGCGRGYLLKRFADYAEIRIAGLEISEHCYLTRATDCIATHDVAKPWPITEDGSFDLCLSVAFLEHIPEDQLPALFAEMQRTCRRGLHGIDVHDGDAFDQTHVTMRPLAWWRKRLPTGHEAVDKEDLERGPVPLPSGIDRGVKLNLGSFTHMFHGWRNSDRLDLSTWASQNGYRFTRCDLLSGIPYDDGIADLIFLSHVLEHFDYTEGRRLLAECRRVLKPGGVLRVAVPDADKLMTQYYGENRISELGEICGHDRDVNYGSDVRLLHELLYGGDHRAIYDIRELVNAFSDANFSSIAHMGFRQSGSPVMRRETIDLYPDMSLYVEGTA